MNTDSRTISQHEEDASLARSVKRLTVSARAMCEQRFTEEGAKAPKGSSNPYRAGSAAATWWQRGHDAAPPTSPYNSARIAWELQRTAMGDAHYGNALRVAKDMPGVTNEERSLLDRFATGRNGGTDHVALQALALRIAGRMT